MPCLVIEGSKTALIQGFDPCRCVVQYIAYCAYRDRCNRTLGHSVFLRQSAGTADAHRLWYEDCHALAVVTYALQLFVLAQPGEKLEMVQPGDEKLDMAAFYLERRIGAHDT